VKHFEIGPMVRRPNSASADGPSPSDKQKPLLSLS
jgi:hypothetical protein